MQRLDRPTLISFGGGVLFGIFAFQNPVVLIFFQLPFYVMRALELALFPITHNQTTWVISTISGLVLYGLLGSIIWKIPRKLGILLVISLVIASVLIAFQDFSFPLT